MSDTDTGPALARPYLREMEDGAAEADPSHLPQMIEDPVSRVAAVATPPRGPGMGRLAAWVFGGLFSLILSVAAWNFVTGLLAQNSWLGWLAFGLTVLALLVLAALAMQEISAFLRQGRLDGLRRAAREAKDMAAARAVVGDVMRLYRGRAEVAWGLARLEDQRPDLLDADALLAMAEIELMAPLDLAALVEVEAAARQVAAATALVPLALVDVMVALVANLRMIRRLSEIYGGRSGRLGSLRMLRRVGVALLGAGAVGLADDLLGSLAGGGVMAKVSRRFGEGVVNGALTARLGLTAMEELRPMPFRALARPGASRTVSKALAGLFGRGDEDKT